MVVVGLFLIGAAGCSGGSGASAKPLDCAYLAGDNCWKTTAAPAAGCLPASTDVGMLSADGKTCTYASGHVVTFATPLTLPVPTSNNTENWDFTVTDAAGQPCLAYKNNTSIVLTVQGQTVKEGSAGGLGLSLTCPDGTSYSNSNAFALLSCSDSGLFGFDLPGDAWSSSDTSLSLSLTGVPSSTGDSGISDSGLPVFNCQTGA
jgi:hypothetical protein